MYPFNENDKNKPIYLTPYHRNLKFLDSMFDGLVFYVAECSECFQKDEETLCPFSKTDIQGYIFTSNQLHFLNKVPCSQGGFFQKRNSMILFNDMGSYFGFVNPVYSLQHSTVIFKPLDLIGMVVDDQVEYYPPSIFFDKLEPVDARHKTLSSLMFTPVYENRNGKSVKIFSCCKVYFEFLQPLQSLDDTGLKAGLDKIASDYPLLSDKRLFV